MFRNIIGCAILLITSSIIMAEDTWVNGYTRNDGTYVEGHYRSRPNAYQWDNKSYEPSQPAYNASYNQPTKNYNSNWYQPSETRYQDNNPYNNSAPAYGTYEQPKSRYKKYR